MRPGPAMEIVQKNCTALAGYPELDVVKKAIGTGRRHARPGAQSLADKSQERGDHESTGTT